MSVGFVEPLLRSGMTVPTRPCQTTSKGLRRQPGGRAKRSQGPGPGGRTLHPRGSHPEPLVIPASPSFAAWGFTYRVARPAVRCRGQRKKLQPGSHGRNWQIPTDCCAEGWATATEAVGAILSRTTIRAAMSFTVSPSSPGTCSIVARRGRHRHGRRARSSLRESCGVSLSTGSAVPHQPPSTLLGRLRPFEDSRSASAGTPAHQGRTASGVRCRRAARLSRPGLRTAGR